MRHRRLRSNAGLLAGAMAAGGRTARRAALASLCLCAVLAAVTPLIARPSAQAEGGASGAECDRPFEPGRQTTMTLTSGGAERTVVLYVPTGYDGRHRVPLILNLHGSTQTAAEAMLTSELNRTAELENVVVAAPQGLLSAPPGFRWNVPGVTTTDPAAPDDERFLSDAIDHLQSLLCIDARRVYGFGVSGGARMLSQYACDHADRLAAAAAVNGLRAGVPVTGPEGPHPDPVTCTPSRPVPVLAFHGTADPIVPYDGGDGLFWQYGVAAAQARWAQLNGCRQRPRTRRITRHVDRISYRACRDHADVVLYRVEGGGHTTPGSVAAIPLRDVLGPVTFEVDGPALAWSFFERHTRTGGD